MSFLVARGKRNGYSFESYSPLPVSNIEGSKGKVMQLGVFTRVDPSGSEIDYTCAVFASNRVPPNNVKQSWFCNFFQVSATYRGQSGTADIDLNSNPNFMSYDNEKKVGIFSFNFTNNNPSSIGGLGPSSFFTFYSPRDNVFYGVHYLGRYYTAEGSDNSAFWEKVSHFTPKLPFEIDISTTGGGDGEYDDNSSDIIGLPDLTTLNENSINNTRFFTCYKLSPEELTKLSQELWSTNFINIISNSVLKPTDFIVSMNMIPIDVSSTPKLIKAGQWLLNGAIGGVVSGQFFRVDCGSIQIKKKWGGALDYLTKIALFLPFIGEVQLSPDDVMGSTISIIYTVDVMTGSCLASVKIVRDNLNAILYQYNGNCSSTYPIVSQDYSALMSGVLQLGIHSVADYSKSLPQLNKKGTNKGAIKNAKISRREDLVSGATSCLFDISPNVQRVGNMSSTVGFMGIKKPFIILSRPIQSLAQNYNTYRGFVSNITMTLGNCEGYTEVEEIHLENISATENEISEIEDLLKSGVIF